jgi:nucleotide-binding universal stress UspA family protein
MKTLIAYDGSNSSLDALKLAVSHAKVFKAKVFLVTSLYGEHEESDEEVGNSEERLKKAEKLVTKEGIACESHLLVRGMAPGEDILQFAKDHQVDLIYIGIKRRSKVGKLFFGSNAQYIILNAPCPVVSLR